MDVLALVIAILALVLSTVAISRTGGIGVLQKQAEEARRMTANAIGRVEDAVRPHRKDGEVPLNPEGEAEAGDPMSSGEPKA